MLRRSSDILAINIFCIAKALRFIWDHFDEPIGVETVVAQTGRSRSFVYQEFDSTVSRSVAKEITRCRINKAKNLLTHSELSISEISADCGFAGRVSFCRAFNREAGTTASACRQQEPLA